MIWTSEFGEIELARLCQTTPKNHTETEKELQKFA